MNLCPRVSKRAAMAMASSSIPAWQHLQEGSKLSSSSLNCCTSFLLRHRPLCCFNLLSRPSKPTPSCNAFEQFGGRRRTSRRTLFCSSIVTSSTEAQTPLLPLRKAYPFHVIEQKWQHFWEANQTFRTPDTVDTSKPKFYVLDMFPYPRYTHSSFSPIRHVNKISGKLMSTCIG